MWAFDCLDYVGFIKKIMKLLQKGFNEIQALEVELRILEQTSAPPTRPRKSSSFHFQMLLKLFPLEIGTNKTSNISQNDQTRLPNAIKYKYPARDGHLIFCYGDCNRKFEEGLSASRASISGLRMRRHGDDCDDDTGQDQQHNELMKKFWLEIYNRHYKFKQK